MAAMRSVILSRLMMAAAPKRYLHLTVAQAADKMMADPVEHATGREKVELLAKAAGNMDPFQLNVVKRAAGTKENPTIIPSRLDRRIVGCICEEDQTYINWMWIDKNSPKRCGCGYWFKMVEGEHLPGEELIFHH
ncbi:unnamed protein product [Darwinula stevensoni]|uniref:Uncharacterized protein n=1 Tax=Darwinula stevensoni TaxID=69355 RepID=A0A7R8XG20_9CRUS|nr:unnamed protein product [Darwinula stevensoni]CAG0889324.1 unnamed protein product [Darwinula stevensoni]